MAAVKKTRCKIIPGVEINCQGIHLFLYFPENLYGKPTFSAGLHAFALSNLTLATGLCS